MSKRHLSPGCSKPTCLNRSHRQLLNRLCNSQLADGFIAKLSNHPSLITRLQAKYITAVPLPAFLKELERLHCRFSAAEVQSFLTKYGHPSHGLPLLVLSKQLGRPGSSMRSAERSRRLSQSASNAPGYKKPALQIGPAPLDISSFKDQILSYFDDLWQTVDYFFVSRDSPLDMESFTESCQSLGVSQLFEDISTVFASLSAGKPALDKTSFIASLQNKEARQDEELLRSQLKHRFASALEAFQSLAEQKTGLELSDLRLRLKFFNIKVPLKKLKRLFPCKEVSFEAFKRFWCIIKGVCAVKSCEKERRDESIYCQAHSGTLMNRANAFLGRIRALLPDKRKKTIDGMIQEFKEHSAAQAIRWKIEAVAPGQQCTKKDIVAIQELVRLSERHKERRAKKSHSPLMRTANVSKIARFFSFSKSPARRIVRLKQLS